MQLQKINLLNFRQFYGNQEINFSTDPQKNVTLIHAENGVGKTTLLNALLWCFYKHTSSDFELADLIVSNQAVEEGNHQASVEVTFIDNGKTFCVKRSIDQEYKDETFQAFEIVSGNFEQIRSAQVFVESVIPKEMSKYFFFDGEYAETFASSNNKKAVQTAVESMLGCNIALQALKDLNALKKQLNKEMADVSKGNSQAQIFQNKIDQANRFLTENQDSLQTIERNKEFSEDVRDKISSELRATKGADTIQLEKEQLNRQKIRLDNERKKLESAESKWIYADSFGLLSNRVSKACLGVVESAHVEGNLPSKIAETFVNDILKREVCICGVHFKKDSSEFNKIRSLIKEAGTSTMNDRLVDIRSRLDRLKDTKLHAVGNYRVIVEKLANHDGEVGNIELLIKECDAKLSGNEIRDVADKQNAIKTEEANIEEANKEIGRYEIKIKGLLDEISSSTIKRDKYLATSGTALNIQSKLAVVDAAHQSLETQLHEYRRDSRIAIEEKVNEILRLTARRSYRSSIDEQFNLNMHYSDTDQLVAKSKGENQLLSLAFIASLVSFSADRRNKPDEILKPGTIAPLMLDSPFGQLDPPYRQSTAGFLPGSTGQVILLLSQTQGDGSVIDILKDHIGEECILISEVTTDRGDKPEDLITIKGKSFACSRYNAGKNRTVIQRVE